MLIPSYFLKLVASVTCIVLLKLYLKNYKNLFHDVPDFSNNQKTAQEKKTLSDHSSQKRGGGGPGRYDHDHRFNGFFLTLPSRNIKSLYTLPLFTWIIDVPTWSAANHSDIWMFFGMSNFYLTKHFDKNNCKNKTKFLIHDRSCRIDTTYLIQNRQRSTVRSV